MEQESKLDYGTNIMKRRIDRNGVLPPRRVWKRLQNHYAI